MKEQYTVDGYRVDLYFPSQFLTNLLLNAMNLDIKIEIWNMKLLVKNILKLSLAVHLFDITLIRILFNIFDVINRSNIYSYKM